MTQGSHRRNNREQGISQGGVKKKSMDCGSPVWRVSAQRVERASTHGVDQAQRDGALAGGEGCPQGEAPWHEVSEARQSEEGTPAQSLSPSGVMRASPFWACVSI